MLGVSGELMAFVFLGVLRIGVFESSVPGEAFEGWAFGTVVFWCRA